MTDTSQTETFGDSLRMMRSLPRSELAEWAGMRLRGETHGSVEYNRIKAARAITQELEFESGRRDLNE